MASIKLEPPSQFNFAKPDEWPKWKRRFEQFRRASKLDGESKTRQVETLLYCMGEEAESVLLSTGCTAEEREKYDTVVSKMDEHFKVRRNVIFERARFNRRCQKEGESIEQYITALYDLAEFCEYGTLRDEMIRDRLVVGILDQALSERMQTDSELSLEKAKTMVRQKASVREQCRELQQQDSEATIERIRSRQAPRRGQHGQPSKCTRCGLDKHPPRVRCPALGATCHNCYKKNHFKAQCFSKAVSAVVTQSDPELEMCESDEPFLGAVTSNEKLSWTIDIRMRKKTVNFKMDTGAEVTAINPETYRLLGKPRLYQPTKVLYGPSHHALKVLGQTTVFMRHKGCSARQKIYVVEGLKKNLLGLPAMTQLQLVCRVDSTELSGHPIAQQFPTVFKGLGTIGNELYHQTQRKICSLFPVCATQCSHSPATKGQGGTGENGKTRGNLKGPNPNSIVLWNGGCTQEIRCSTNMC